MYKVRYYINNSNKIGIKFFETLAEAVAFSRKAGVENIIDTVLMKDDE